MEKLIGPGKGESILVHVGTNNVERQGHNCHSSEIQAVSQDAKAGMIWADNHVRDFASNGIQGSGISKCQDYRTSSAAMWGGLRRIHRFVGLLCWEG